MSARHERVPADRLRLVAKPLWTGSAPVRKTIGIVEVAASTAGREYWPFVMITATPRRTRSAAKLRQPVGLLVRPTEFDHDIAAFDESGLAQPPAES